VPVRTAQVVEDSIDGKPLPEDTSTFLSSRRRWPMNNLDEFVEVALVIFVALTLLIWLLTYLESVAEKRTRGVIPGKRPAPPDNN
jgi:hypothetical protein